MFIFDAYKVAWLHKFWCEKRLSTLNFKGTTHEYQKYKYYKYFFSLKKIPYRSSNDILW
jgi:hypothetical protein